MPLQLCAAVRCDKTATYELVKCSKSSAELVTLCDQNSISALLCVCVCVAGGGGGRAGRGRGEIL